MYGVDGGATGIKGEDIIPALLYKLGDETMVGGDTDNIFLIRGECGGGGNLPDDSKLGMMLLPLVMLPGGGFLLSSPSPFFCPSNVFATGDDGRGSVCCDVNLDSSSSLFLFLPPTRSGIDEDDAAALFDERSES